MTTKLLHPVIRLVCLVAAVAAPMSAAFVCRFISRIAIERIIPHSIITHLLPFSQTWVAGAADGSFPLVLIALLLSAAVAVAGLYILFSKRLSADAVASALTLICCISYTAAVVFLGNTMMGLVLPFFQPVSQ
jgi:hypothetical protein